MVKEIKPGTIVTTMNKTGKYIAEVIESKEHRVLVKTMAVLRHPTQGDLHNPHQVNVVFHQRRALAMNEKTWVHPHSVHPYEEEVPSYEESLKKALQAEIDKLQENVDEWSQRSIEMLEDLKNDYFKGN